MGVVELSQRIFLSFHSRLHKGGRNARNGVPFLVRKLPAHFWNFNFLLLKESKAYGQNGALQCRITHHLDYWFDPKRLRHYELQLPWLIELDL